MRDRLTTGCGHKGFLYPCPGCGVNRAADDGHHLCRECEGYTNDERCAFVVGEQHGEPVECGAVRAIHGDALGMAAHPFQPPRTGRSTDG